MIRSLVAWFAAFILVGNATAEQAQPIETVLLREAATKPLRLIQKSQGVWYENATCTSCHHQILPAIAQSVALDRGVEFDAVVARDVAEKSFSHLKDLDAIVQGYDYIDEVDEAWKLVGAHAAGVPPSLSTSAAAQFLASAQRPDGSWYTSDGRPPQSYSRFTTTAVCARGMTLYLPEQFREEKQIVLQRAREWFLHAQPRTTEDRTFQLLGLFWTGANAKQRKEAAQGLLAAQREDGGWSQLPRLGSDAYSTGTVLYALHQGAGLATTDPVYQRGLHFLLKTQEADGSWRVASRLHPSANPSPEYFDAGFPHDRRHQYSSITGTNWATMALLLAVPAHPGRKPKATALPELAPTEKDEWIHVTLNGSVADLQKALAAGLKPDVRTKRGTTALMLAARSAPKVKLLIEHGADVNARAASGFTALIIAARYHGNAEVVRLLLRHGATLKAEKDVKVMSDASALFFAAGIGDVEMARTLLDAGAMVDEKMLVLGVSPQSPLDAATSRGDTAMAEFLIERKADLNVENKYKLTPLFRATINSHAETVKLLITKGARVNHQDDMGFTPLVWAAYIDPGDTAVVELLLAAGADRNAKDDQGRIALEVARELGHTAIATVLAGRAPPP